jgi:glycine/D-amino acid oxidase-like deaminating enzyme
MRNPGPDDNLWRAAAGLEIDAPALEQDVACDVAIVGGGYTGCSAALHLAEAGVDVRLLEARTIGHGGSGRNVGLVNAGLWAPPDTVEETLGKLAGSKLNQALAAGPDLVFSLIERHGIDCEATRAGTLHCAINAAGLADLNDRLKQQVARSAPVELLSANETAKRTGADGFRGALLDRRAGTIQPLAYARGLALAARDAGTVLHEGSPVYSLRHAGTGWRIKTPKGSITAAKVIVATNAYHEALETAQPSFTAVPYFQLATAPLSENLRRSILGGGEGCWDTATVMTSFRLDAAGRMILGAVGSLEGLGAATHQRWARRKLRALFPALADYSFEYAWYGRIAMTADHLPKITRLGPGALQVFGYSGRGISPGTVFGKGLAAWAWGGDENHLPAPVAESHEESFTGMRGCYYSMGAALTHLVRARP